MLPGERQHAVPWKRRGCQPRSQVSWFLRVWNSVSNRLFNPTAAASVCMWSQQTWLSVGSCLITGHAEGVFTPRLPGWVGQFDKLHLVLATCLKGEQNTRTIQPRAVWNGTLMEEGGNPDWKWQKRWPSFDPLQSLDELPRLLRWSGVSHQIEWTLVWLKTTLAWFRLYSRVNTRYQSFYCLQNRVNPQGEGKLLFLGVGTEVGRVFCFFAVGFTCFWI